MKKLLIFLMIALPVIVIVIMNTTISVVTDIVPIPVEKIELNNKTYVSNIDETYQLIANIFPTNATDKSVIFESSNQDILTVDKDGKVSFKNFGSAYVTVTTLDGNKQSSCYFVVTDTKVHSVMLYTIDNVSEVNVGATLDFYSEILPKQAVNQNVIYSSSNENVATINENGILQALSVGETSIKVTTVDGEYIDTKKITVFREIESFELSQNNVVLEKPFYQIPVNISPIDAKINRINFSSSDKEIATVSKTGVVNFYKEGNVTITLSHKNSTKTISLHYTNGYIQDINLKNSFLYCNYDDTSFVLDFETYPQNLYNTEIKFSSSNVKVAEIDSNGLIDLKSGGKTTITVEANRYDGTVLSKNITLFVERDCTEIIAQDIVTAKSNVSVIYDTLPIDNTSDDFVYEVDGEIATVDNMGNVKFSSSGTINLTIKSKLAEKTIKITYTGGYALDFDIANSLDMYSGETEVLIPSYIPSNTEFKNVEYAILSQNPTIKDEIVIEINQNKITALSSGNAYIEAKLICNSNQVVTKNIYVNVKQQVSEIEFDLNLEFNNNEYISSMQTVDLKTRVLPLDATEIDILYEVDDKEACSINGNKLFFNYPATVLLTATNKINKVKKSISVRYTNTIVYAELENFENNLNIDDIIEIKVSKCIPNAFNTNLMLKIVSQKNSSGKNVVEILDNTIKAINGGEAQISVYLSGIFTKTFTVNVNRLIESLDIFPKNIKTTSNQVVLYSTILPEDATNKEIAFHLDNENIATINENTLHFLKNGMVNITACTTDGSNIKVEFTIEKISLNQNISTDTKEHIIYVGQNVQLKSSEYSEIEYFILSGEENIAIDNEGLVFAKKAGTSIVNIILKESNGFVEETKTIKFYIYELTKDFDLENFDKYNQTYLTANSENALIFKVEPEKAQQKIEYTLSDTTIAKIEHGNLIFYGVGVVELRANSIDQNCIKVFSIRYTGGNAYAYESNIDKNVTLMKGNSINVEISKWYPENTINKSFSIKVLGDVNQKIINIENTKITALSGGEIDVVLRVSANLTEVIKVIVEEEILGIKFKNLPVITYETSLPINLEFFPETAKNAMVEYSIDNEENAYIINNVLIFKKPSKIKLTVFIKDNKQIFDEMEIESTMGFVKDFELKENSITLNTGSIYQPQIINFKPNVINQVYLYEIVESNPIIKNDTVVTIQNNKIIAQNGGTAKIKVYAKSDFENAPFKYLEIKVVKELQRLDVRFDRDLFIKDQTYILASNSLIFEVTPFPLDIDIDDYNIIYDKDYVKIENNIIQFLKSGVTTIKFEFGEISNSFDFIWTNNQCIEAKIKESEFNVVAGRKVKQVKIGETFEFEIISLQPSDVSYKTINIVEKNLINNYHSLNVYKLDNKVIEFLNGGEVTFEVFVNNISVGDFTFEVIRPAQDIKVETTQYTGVSTYKINAEILPYDTTVKQLNYKLLNTEIASINANGELTFIEEGVVKVVISHIDGISKTIDVIYSRKVEYIAIEKTKTVLSVGGTILLNVQCFPIDIENVNLKFVSSDDSIATVTSKGRVVANDKTGYVTITAYLQEDNTVFDSITFCISKYITNIALKDDITNDNLGIKGERVFGNKYLNEDNTFSNTYQMEILSITPDSEGAELVWTTSDEKIATVDNNGLVTFVTYGEVTIRVEPKDQFSMVRPVYDSYTFKVVDAVNVTNFDEYLYCSKNNLAVVLQNDLILTDSIIQKHSLTEIKIANNLYGNGFMITAYGLNEKDNKFIVGSNLVVDNVTIRGEDLTNKTLEDLTYKSNLIILWYVQNVTFNNCILENGLHCIRVYCSVVNFNGCILRNGGISNLILSHESNSQIQTIVTAKNCIFKDALFGSIVYDFDNSDNDTYASKFIVKEKIYIYNFRRADEMVCPIVSDYVPNITASLQELFSQFENIKHKYNGKEYYHLGIIMLNADYVVGKYYTKYKLDLSEMENSKDYSITNVSGNIFVYDVYPIIFDIGLLTIMPGSNTITPASSFDSTIYKEIREI